MRQFSSNSAPSPVIWGKREKRVSMTENLSRLPAKTRTAFAAEKKSLCPVSVIAPKCRIKSPENTCFEPSLREEKVPIAAEV